MPQLVTDGLTPAQDKYVVEALRGWKGGPLSDKLFTVLAGILPQSIVDVVIPRIHEGVLQVLLTRRSKNDPLWPYMLYLPGSAMRRAEYEKYGEEAIHVAFERIEREIGSPFLARPTLAGIRDYLSVRGPETSRFHVGLVDPNIPLPEGAEWARVDGLKDRAHEFIIEHLPIIEQAVDYYRRRILKEPGLTEEEILLLVDLLRRIPPGQLDPRIFEALAPRTPQVYIETVTVRKLRGRYQVLATPRPLDDLAFPGFLHSPGSALRNGDFDKEPQDPPLVAIRRVEKRELHIEFARCEFVGLHFYDNKVRGKGVGLVYVCRLPKGANLPEDAGWFYPEALIRHPQFLPDHVPVVEKAISFLTRR